jgi:hypothetical protein
MRTLGARLAPQQCWAVILGFRRILTRHPARDALRGRAIDPTHLSALKPFETNMFDFQRSDALDGSATRLYIAFSRQN